MTWHGTIIESSISKGMRRCDTPGCWGVLHCRITRAGLISGLLRLAAGVALVVLCARGEEAAIRFTDVTAAAGLSLRPRGAHPDKRVANAAPNFDNVYDKGYYAHIADVCFADVRGTGRWISSCLTSPITSGRVCG